MRVPAKLFLSTLLLLPLFVPLGGCGCGFSCNSDEENDPAVLTLGFSDSTPEDLKQVEIEVDTITFRRSGAQDVVIEKFTIKEQNISEAETFSIDLLEYKGAHQLLVIEDLELDTGTYSEVLIAILDDDVNHSFVLENDDTQKVITVSGGTLTVPGMTLAAGAQQFTVEFSLPQSLQFQTSSGHYLLANDGLRIDNNATAATLSGTISSDLFDSVSPCNEKVDPEAGNRAYLYRGGNLSLGSLADVFTTNSSTEFPANALAPFDVAAIAKNTFTGNWEYAFGYVPAGNYTLAFACNTAADDAVDYDDLIIPQPVGQLYEISLSEAEKATCNLATGASC